MLPIQLSKNLVAGNATTVVNAQAVTAPGVAFTLATSSLDTQRRLLITAAGNEAANSFVVVGTNQAGFPITETVTGPNASTTQSNLDFKSITSIKALATTADTVSVGLNGVGSSLWQIVNWHVSPSNIEVAAVVMSAVSAVNYTIQYTYDDPNNLPSGVSTPQPFNHPTLAALTASLDGSINDPITAWRLTVNSGTGTVRATGIQAGIGGP